MQRVYLDTWYSIVERENKFINDCLDTIKSIVSEEPNATLSFGNTILKVMNDEVYINVNKTNFVLLYSEDGYDQPNDIAHWADVVVDVHNCYFHGNKEYTVNWNVKVPSEK